MFLGLLLMGYTTTAWAQDGDWLDNDDDKDDKKDDRNDDEEEDIDLNEDPDEKKIQTPTNDKSKNGKNGKKTQDGGLDLGEEYETKGMRAEGEDDADIYRNFKAELERLDPAEESIAWSEYLEKYPKSIFKPAIEQRIAELEGQLYDERIEDKYLDRDKEDGKAEIKLTQPIFLSNIDPRQKLHVGFEMGFPAQFNVLLDYEHQLKREWSVHAGLRPSVSGKYLDVGTKYALIKSARLQMLTTGNFDIMLGNNVGFRPTVGWGKRFTLKNDMLLDTMAQVGTELIVSPVFDPRLQGGFQVAVAPTDSIRFFLEGSVYMKDFAWDKGDAFAFNTITFGLKFFDGKDAQKSKYEVAAAANAPYYYKYWRQHFGSITGDMNWYFK